MLNSKEMETITVEMLCEKPPSILGPDADQFRKELQVDIDEAKAKGQVIDIPFEIEVADD